MTPSLQKKDKQNHFSRSWSSAFTDDDPDAVTDLFHQRQQQFAYVRKTEVAVQYGGEALSHEEMPASLLVTSESHASLSLFGDHEQGQLVQPRSVAGSRALEARVERCLEGMGRHLGHNVTHTGVYP